MDIFRKKPVTLNKCQWKFQKNRFFFPFRERFSYGIAQGGIWYSGKKNPSLKNEMKAAGFFTLSRCFINWNSRGSDSKINWKSRGVTSIKIGIDILGIYTLEKPIPEKWNEVWYPLPSQMEIVLEVDTSRHTSIIREAEAIVTTNVNCLLQLITVRISFLVNYLLSWIE